MLSKLLQKDVVYISSYICSKTKVVSSFFVKKINFKTDKCRQVNKHKKKFNIQ